MDISKKKSKSNPKDLANPFSTLMFGYTFGFFKKGYKKTLEVEDIYDPINRDRSKLLGERLEANWNIQIEKAKKYNKKPSLMKALVATFWVEFGILGLALGINEFALKLFQPIFLGWLLDYFRPGSTESKEAALLYAGLIVGTNAIIVLLYNQYLFECSHSGMRIRVACCSLIYRKATKLSKTALGDTASGKIVNLLSNDVSRCDIVSLVINPMWIAPLSTLVIFILIYRDSGISGTVGIFAIIIVTIFQAYTGKLAAIYRKQTAIKSDERIRLMDEVLGGVQVIKMYAWERPFKHLIALARAAEIKIVTKSSYVRGVLMAFNLFNTRCALFFSLLTVALSGEEITASRVFVIAMYFNIVAFNMGHLFIRGISEIAELFVGVKRIESFILNEEFDPNKTQSYMNGNVKNVDDFRDIVSLKNLTVKWNQCLSDNALEDVTLTVSDGKLLGIIGPVGSGKSSLLQTILGELDIIKGDLSVRGQVSYASQEPWVFAATIRQNILFGEPYDKDRYQDVVEVCALETDFKQFENGDLTIVGDRGASLSGGQKARINLARAVYRRADLYLLDDPLSAVDIHVSKHLYEKCINGYLGNKARVLVTHQVHYLKNADHVIILYNGHVEAEGTFNALANSDNMYAKLFTADPESEAEKQRMVKYNRQFSERSRRGSSGSLASAVSDLSIAESLLVQLPLDEDEVKKGQFEKKDLQEESSKGKVKGSLLFHYITSGTNILAGFILVALFLITQLSASVVDYWVGFWVNIEESKSVLIKNVFTTRTTEAASNQTATETILNQTTPEVLLNATIKEARSIDLFNLSTETCLYIYAGILFSLLILALSRSLMFYKLCMWSSKKLHSILYDSVVGATMRFFDINPGGRILNRFSKDIGSIDEMLPKVLLDAVQIFLQITGSLILISIINPYILTVMAVIFVIFAFIRHVYLKTSMNVKRLEGILRSPVFTHLRATIEGLTTIRAFNAQDILIEEFDSHQDYHSSAWFSYLCTSSAFGFYIDVFCAVFIGLLTFSFLTFGESLGMKSGEVGLAISQATTLMFWLQWALRNSAETSNQLMSVERVLEYKLVQKEPQPVVPQVPPKGWPHKGEIQLEDMSLRYFNNGPLVLKHLNLGIKTMEKIGVVGRTGAGKSSLIQAIFRLAPIEGSIRIDDIDTKDISLEQLRSKISIIPQDPVLFSGTLRYNLDPFDEYTDEVLYRAIQDVELKDNVINKLENRVMDRGSNYSVGQRQLICLARAILKQNRILMLDEATANVDPQTDALIQKAIRKKFVDCTVITVAHRLNTIMDSDKVLVMSAGQVAEFDHPHLLLQNHEGVFYKMVKETGKATADQLRRIAQDNYKKIGTLQE